MIPQSLETTQFSKVPGLAQNFHASEPSCGLGRFSGGTPPSRKAGRKFLLFGFHLVLSLIQSPTNHFCLFQPSSWKFSVPHRKAIKKFMKKFTASFGRDPANPEG